MNATTMLFIGEPTGPSEKLRAALGDSTFVALPEYGDLTAGEWGWSWRNTLEAWEATATAGPSFPQVVVCCWDPIGDPQPFLELDPGQWIEQVEQRIALWFMAVKVGAARCADGGSMVVVVERPVALDSPGRSTLVASSEGMIALTRSVAADHGRRDVRVNSVVTEVRTAPAELLGPAPALSTFPGRIESEVAGAVRLLMSDDACGVSAATITPDGGRAA